ncbi:unnamed protein product, partial [Mesorhabditis spiculigera]
MSIISAILIERCFAHSLYPRLRSSAKKVDRCGNSCECVLYPGTGTVLYLVFGARFLRDLFVVMLPLVFCYLGSCFLFFLKIYFLNAKNLRTLLRTYSLRKYSLSRRFQLEENMRSLHLIRRIFSAHIVMSVFGTCVFLMPHMYFGTNSPELEVSLAGLECFQAIFAIMFNTGLIALVPSWRRRFAEILRNLCPTENTVSEEPSCVSTKKRPIAHDETQIYFSQLQNAWQ